MSKDYFQQAFPFGGMNLAGGEAFQKSYERAMSFTGGYGEFGRKQMEAFAESARITTKGMEAIGTRAAEYSRGCFDKNMEAAKAISSAKSVQEAMELQSEYSKATFDEFMSEMNAAATQWATLFKDASEPLNAQAGEVVSSMRAKF